MAEAERARLFFALWPDPTVRAALEGLGREAPGGSRGRRIAAPNLHLTLVFLGWSDAELQACAERVAGTAAGETGVGPFTLELDRVGHFRRTQVLWVGASRTPPPLAELVGALNRGLEGCGVPPPGRAFRPHVTVARKVRRAQPVEIDPVPWRVERFSLVRSTLHPEGARYEVLAEWPLAAAEG
ncbi:MAG: RNA 2',3'-cyclic phosphodiesterase [Gammaproteobacteria bacterium]|nr:RNA 2',3'-cyclic phosphodiesterase [Gammaproteobacteria bacterium]